MITKGFTTFAVASYTGSHMTVGTAFFNGSTLVFSPSFDVTLDADTTLADVRADLYGQIDTFITGMGETFDSSHTVDLVLQRVIVPSGLASAPQAAIVNAPADAVTNYNVLTTLLGSLTGAVNTANTKQNDIATKLNSLLTELRTLGLIAP